MCDGALHSEMPRSAPPEPASVPPANIDTLPTELIIVHVLPHLSNGEKGALAKTCSQMLGLLRHERVYYLSALSTRAYFEDATFCEEVKARIPAAKLVLRPFECAIRALHFPPFEFKRARALFIQALADKSATELERARANLSLCVLYEWKWGGPDDWVGYDQATADNSAPLLLREGDERDPVRAFETGCCHLWAFGRAEKPDYAKAVELLTLSADGGCAAGVTLLAYCLANGWGVRRSLSAGAAQWERATAMGHYGAMYAFGCYCLYEGMCSKVPRDKRRGAALIRRAAEGGSWEAVEWLRDKTRRELERLGL